MCNDLHSDHIVDCTSIVVEVILVVIISSSYHYCIHISCILIITSLEIRHETVQ